eukprot:Opistho-1_new@69565
MRPCVRPRQYGGLISPPFLILIATLPPRSAYSRSWTRRWVGRTAFAAYVAATILFLGGYYVFLIVQFFRTAIRESDANVATATLYSFIMLTLAVFLYVRGVFRGGVYYYDRVAHVSENSVQILNEIVRTRRRKKALVGTAFGFVAATVAYTLGFALAGLDESPWGGGYVNFYKHHPVLSFTDSGAVNLALWAASSVVVKVHLVIGIERLLLVFHAAVVLTQEIGLAVRDAVSLIQLECTADTVATTAIGSALRRLISSAALAHRHLRNQRRLLRGTHNSLIGLVALQLCLSLVFVTGLATLAGRDGYWAQTSWYLCGIVVMTRIAVTAYAAENRLFESVAELEDTLEQAGLSENAADASGRATGVRAVDAASGEKPGAPSATQTSKAATLLHRLLENGTIHTRRSILTQLSAMCGVSPLPAARSNDFAGSAGDMRRQAILFASSGSHSMKDVAPQSTTGGATSGGAREALAISEDEQQTLLALLQDMIRQAALVAADAADAVAQNDLSSPVLGADARKLSVRSVSTIPLRATGRGSTSSRVSTDHTVEVIDEEVAAARAPDDAIGPAQAWDDVVAADDGNGFGPTEGGNVPTKRKNTTTARPSTLEYMRVAMIETPKNMASWRRRGLRSSKTTAAANRAATRDIFLELSTTYALTLLVGAVMILYVLLFSLFPTEQCSDLSLGSQCRPSWAAYIWRLLFVTLAHAMVLSLGFVCFPLIIDRLCKRALVPLAVNAVYVTVLFVARTWDDLAFAPIVTFPVVQLYDMLLQAARNPVITQFEESSRASRAFAIRSLVAVALVGAYSRFVVRNVVTESFAVALSFRIVAHPLVTFALTHFLRRAIVEMKSIPTHVGVTLWYWISIMLSIIGRIFMFKSRSVAQALLMTTLTGLLEVAVRLSYFKRGRLSDSFQRFVHSAVRALRGRRQSSESEEPAVSGEGRRVEVVSKLRNKEGHAAHIAIETIVEVQAAATTLVLVKVLSKRKGCYDFAAGATSDVVDMANIVFMLTIGFFVDIFCMGWEHKRGIHVGGLLRRIPRWRFFLFTCCCACACVNLVDWSYVRHCTVVT